MFKTHWVPEPESWVFVTTLGVAKVAPEESKSMLTLFQDSRKKIIQLFADGIKKAERVKK